MLVCVVLHANLERPRADTLDSRLLDVSVVPSLRNSLKALTVQRGGQAWKSQWSILFLSFAWTVADVLCQLEVINLSLLLTFPPFRYTSLALLVLKHATSHHPSYVQHGNRLLFYLVIHTAFLTTSQVFLSLKPYLQSFCVFWWPRVHTVFCVLSIYKLLVVLYNFPCSQLQVV